jgi:hypothetical protein
VFWISKTIAQTFAATLKHIDRITYGIASNGTFMLGFIIAFIALYAIAYNPPSDKDNSSERAGIKSYAKFWLGLAGKPDCLLCILAQWLKE